MLLVYLCGFETVRPKKVPSDSFFGLEMPRVTSSLCGFLWLCPLDTPTQAQACGLERGAYGDQVYIDPGRNSTGIFVGISGS